MAQRAQVRESRALARADGGVATNAGAFESLKELLEDSIASGATITRMAVFRARRPGEAQGPRVWNPMLLRFAGYAGLGGPETGGVLGDPATVELTSALISRFGWTPPSPKSRWDVLPLLLQVDEAAAPEMFALPAAFAPTMHVRHLEYPALNALDLRWFTIPIVSSMVRAP